MPAAALSRAPTPSAAQAAGLPVCAAFSSLPSRRHPAGFPRPAGGGDGTARGEGARGTGSRSRCPACFTFQRRSSFNKCIVPLPDGARPRASLHPDSSAPLPPHSRAGPRRRRRRLTRREEAGPPPRRAPAARGRPPPPKGRPPPPRSGRPRRRRGSAAGSRAPLPQAPPGARSCSRRPPTTAPPGTGRTDRCGNKGARGCPGPPPPLPLPDASHRPAPAQPRSHPHPLPPGPLSLLAGRRVPCRPHKACPGPLREVTSSPGRPVPPTASRRLDNTGGVSSVSSKLYEGREGSGAGSHTPAAQPEPPGPAPPPSPRRAASPPASGCGGRRHRAAPLRASAPPPGPATAPAPPARPRSVPLRSAPPALPERGVGRRGGGCRSTRGGILVYSAGY